MSAGRGSGGVMGAPAGNKRILMHLQHSERILWQQIPNISWGEFEPISSLPRKYGPMRECCKLQRGPGLEPLLQTHFDAFKVLKLHLVATDLQYFWEVGTNNWPPEKNSSTPVCFFLLSPNFFQEASCLHMSMQLTPLNHNTIIKVDDLHVVIVYIHCKRRCLPCRSKPTHTFNIRDLDTWHSPLCTKMWITYYTNNNTAVQ